MIQIESSITSDKMPVKTEKEQLAKFAQKLATLSLKLKGQVVTLKNLLNQPKLKAKASVPCQFNGQASRRAEHDEGISDLGVDIHGKMKKIITEDRIIECERCYVS